MTIYQVPGWDLCEANDHLQLARTWKVKSFVKGLEFLKSIGEVAEREGLYSATVLLFWIESFDERATLHNNA
jgi:4a-hydroxytetrahydrobiopterin dehydratase